MGIFNVGGSTEEKMKFMYQMFDYRGDGNVDKGDFECILMLVCGNELTDDEVVEIMDKVFLYVDVDEDGNISYEEFSKIVGRTDVASKVSINSFH